MFSAFQLCLPCFAVFLTSFPCTRVEGLSQSQYNGNGFNNHTRCSWSCTVIHSDFLEQRKTALVKNRLIKLDIEYEKKVNEKCVRHTSRAASGNVTEYFNVWLPPNNKLSSFDNVIQNLFNLDLSSYTEERVKVKAVCNLRPHSRSLEARETTSSPNTGRLLSRFVRSHLADNGVEKTVTVNNTDIHFAEEQRWLGYGFYFFVFVFILAFILYSPAFICLHSPTVVTENGRRWIVLGRASPVDLRTRVASYFYPEEDTVSTWYKARILIFRLVVLPFPFLPFAIIFDYVQHQDELNLRVPLLDLSRPFNILCFVCYVIQAIRDSSFKMANRTNLCIVCRKFKPINFTAACKDPLVPRRLLNHLRLQPLIVVKCWKLFVGCLLSYFKLAQFILSTEWFFRIPVFIVFLLIMPTFVIICLVTMLVVVQVAIFLTSPIVILCTATLYKSSNSNSCLLMLLELLVYCITGLAILGAIVILLCAAITVGLLIIFAFGLLLSEESLPFVALSILVSYYFWSSYSSFLNKYHDLSLMLFKCYQKNRNVITDPNQAENTPRPEDKSNVLKIPKELFDMACEELMPIREGVCILVLKVCLILIFVFLAFFWIMRLHVDSTPGMKALVTFFTGSFPKVVATYFDGGRPKKLEATVLEESAPMIVQDYFNGTLSTNQQDNSGVNTDEVIIIDENDETIEMVNMQR